MENNMNITSAQYLVDEHNVNEVILIVIDGQELNVPLDPANRHYAEILKQVKAGDLTVADAD